MEQRPKPPRGWCECGCGKRTRVAERTFVQKGVSVGEHFRFLHGHGETRYWDKYQVDVMTGCWIWTGRITPDGYADKTGSNGKICGETRPVRIFYSVLIGPIPSGLNLDHLCRTRACVNPFHVEPVTQTENARRGLGTKLTKQQVSEIRERLRTGNWGVITKLSKAYGVTHQTVSAIKNGINWRDK